MTDPGRPPQGDQPRPEPLQQVPIQQAPYEIRKRWLLEERRNSRIAIAVIALVIALAGFGIWRLLAWWTR